MPRPGRSWRRSRRASNPPCRRRRWGGGPAEGWWRGNAATSKGTGAKARALRRILSQPEAGLWQILRSRPAGLKFRRQHPAGPYVLDFYCPKAKLAIEVDGIAHDMGGNPARDMCRDAWLRDSGYRVLRIPAYEIGDDAEAVLQHILNACAE